MPKAYKLLLACLAAMTLAAGMAWTLCSPQLLTGLRERLLSEAAVAVDGRVALGSVAVSLTGAAVLKDVALYDRSGMEVATCKEIEVSYGWRDLMRGSLELDRIKTAELNGLNLHLVQDGTNGWNLQNLMKRRAAAETRFAGAIRINDGRAVVTTPNWQRTFSALTGELRYHEAPDVVVDIAAKMDNTSLKIDGRWGSRLHSAIALTVDHLHLTDLQAMLPPASGRPKLAGMLSTVAMKFIQENNDWKLSGQANLSNFATELNGLAVKDGSAKLQLQGKMLTISEGTATLDADKLLVAGIIDFTSAAPALALQFELPDLAAAALVGGKNSLAGRLAAQGRIGGTLDKPTARGEFLWPSGQLAGNEFSDAQGSFYVSGGILTISQVTAKALGGLLTVSGTLVPQESRYNLKIDGKNVEAAHAIHEGLRGRMDFSVAVSGQGMGAETWGEGQFFLAAARLSGHDLSNVSGNFRKQGESLTLSAVSATLRGQRLHASGSIRLNRQAPPQMALQLSANGVDATAFGLALTGSVAFRAELTGTPDKLRLRGDFGIDSGRLGPWAFSAARGVFDYAEDTLSLFAVKAFCLGGTIETTGTVLPATMSYSQQVSGYGIDAAQLTDRDVEGRADFRATITGTSEGGQAQGSGDFKMDFGSIKGIAVSALSGRFVKRGRQTAFSDLKFDVMGGLATGTGQTEGDYVHLVITPNPSANAALASLAGQSLPPQELRVRYRGADGL